MAASIKKNFIFNLVYQILILIAPIIVTPYVARVLGVDNIGEYSYMLSIVSYFSLFAVLGTTLYGQRAIGYAQHNIEERSKTFWELLIFRIVTCLTTLGIYVIYIFFFCAKSSRLLAIILSVNIVGVIFDVSWFMQGMEEFGKTATASSIFRILNVVLVFCLVKEQTDLWKYVTITVGSSIAGSLILWMFLPKYLCRVKDIRPFKNIKSIIQLFLPTIATQIYTVLDKSMIGWFSDGYSENGYYEQAEKIIKMSVTIVVSLGIVMIPRIANCYKEKQFDRIEYYLYKSYRYVWLMSIPIIFGVISIADVFVPVFFGPGYDKCIILMMILSPLTIAMGFGHVTGLQYFVPTEKQNILTLTYIIGASVNVILNLIFIPFFASIGASVATVISEFCVALSGLIFVKKKKLYALKPIFISSWKYWIAGILMGGLLYLIKLFMPVTVWTLVVLILIGIIVYFLMLLILRDEMIMEILNKFFNRLKHKTISSDVIGDATDCNDDNSLSTSVFDDTAINEITDMENNTDSGST
ncbi:MAG: oligosaccharide flippase family protein [Clostridiales bacterium]|nr:oligosaccharide flippase family protein [Clostridiales bacterium]